MKWILYMACVAALVGCLVPVQAWACGWYTSCDIEISYQGKSIDAKHHRSWDGPISRRQGEKEKTKCLQKVQDIACKKLCREQLCEDMGRTERKVCENSCIADCGSDAAVVKSSAELLESHEPDEYEPIE